MYKLNSPLFYDMTHSQVLGFKTRTLWGTIILFTTLPFSLINSPTHPISIPYPALCFFIAFIIT